MINNQFCVLYLICYMVTSCVVDILSEGSNTSTTLSQDENELNGSCLVPSSPPNGFYKVLSDLGIVEVGTYVLQFTALILDCDEKHNPSPPGRNVSVCFNGKWTPSPATCVLTCPSVESTKTTTVKCTFQETQLDSCKDPVDGVQAVIRCTEFNEQPDIELHPFRRCENGSWDNAFSQCYPICGQKRPKGVPHIIGGVLVKKGEYPWHVNMYEASNKLSICRGSILSNRLVLSAAHCFSRLGNGQKYSADKYLVAAGKYYSGYDDERDDEAQFSNVRDILFPRRYKGELSQYAADIAAVILTTPFIFTLSVQPVCLDWKDEFEQQQVSNGKVGVVVGWDTTEEGSESIEELQDISVPVIPYEQCYKHVLKDFRRFLTQDKVCAGSLTSGRATCQGDSGGGLVFKHTNGRYYIRGIVSMFSATSRFCGTNRYGTFTLVSKYIDFIRPLL